jgi:Ca2+-binding RTX toxin-like protein
LITGGPISESLIGGDGSDTIDGGAGNDTIDGGAAYDQIHGGDGDDSIHGGAGDDALFGDSDAYGGAYGDAYGGAYGGAVNPGNDEIWGDEGNDDLLGGHWAITSNDGNDRMNGGSGNDRFYEVGGNQGNDIITDDQQDTPTYIDWIIFSQWTSAITLHLDTPGSQQNLSGGGSITISNANSIENIWAGSGNDYLYGDGRANYLDGQAGDDHIWGRAGNDSLAGYDGYDYLYGEGDDDLMWPEYGGGEMYGGTGNDTYDFVMTYGNNYFVYEDAIGGSDGSSDTLDFSGAAGPVVLDLANSTTGQSFAGITLKLNDPLGIENVYCSQNTAFNWGDTIYGNARPNILKGGVGNDFIYGRGGADTLLGEDGNDYLDSGGSDGAEDSISGGNGDDTLVNHDGPDVWDTIEHVL